MMLQFVKKASCASMMP